jgi:phenylacetic acid degradation operon negative regulatory protein
VRPDNLRGGVRAQRRQLVGAGLNPDAAVITLADLPREALAEVRALWAVEPLLATHRRLAKALEDSRAQRRTSSPEEAARESLELGSEVISAIIRDPLLPGTMCPPAPRRRLVAMMGAYQQEAQQLWAELLDLDA